MKINSIIKYIIEILYTKDILKNTLHNGDITYVFKISKSNIWFISLSKLKNEIHIRNGYTDLGITSNLIRKNTPLISYKSLYDLWNNYPIKYFFKYNTPKENSKIIFKIHETYTDPMICTGIYKNNKIICTEFEYRHNISIDSNKIKQWSYYSSFYKFFHESF